MTCFSPIQAFKLVGRKTDKGRSVIVFNSPVGETHERVQIPCGQCIGCRIDRSKAWACRCVHEASLYDNNCFITLTFDDENYDVSGSLVKSDFQKFMKRLRKKFKGLQEVDGKYPIRFFHCGEYGAELNRPHHHACLFNFDFEDKKLWTIRNGVRLYRSESLEALWPFGFSTIGDVTVESAAYCARYITKKITGKKADDYYKKVNVDTGELSNIIPEYNSSSRRPGIAANWYRVFKNDVYTKDYFTIEGKKFRAPSYYDRLYEEESEKDFEKIKRKRRLSSCENKHNRTLRRLKTKRKVCESRFKKLIRSYEL